METTKLGKSACRICGEKLDAASDLFTDCKPQPGDISMCAYCGELSAFDDDLLLREITESDIAQMSFIEIQQLQAARVASSKGK